MQGINTLTHNFTATVGPFTVGHFSNRELAVYSIATSEYRGVGRDLRINGEKIPAKEVADALENYSKPDIELIREKEMEAYA